MLDAGCCGSIRAIARGEQHLLKVLKAQGKHIWEKGAEKCCSREWIKGIGADKLHTAGMRGQWGGPKT